MTDRTVFKQDHPGFTLLNPLYFEFKNFCLNIKKPNILHRSEELQTNNGDKWRIEVVFGSTLSHCFIVYCGPKAQCDVMVDFSAQTSLFKSTAFAVTKLDKILTLDQNATSEKHALTYYKGGNNISHSYLSENVIDNLYIVANIWTKNDSILRQDTIHNSLLTDMQAFYDDLSNLNVCFLTDSCERIAAHKVILMARSAVFKTMFSTEMHETSTNEIHISDFSADTVRLFVKYLYTDSCDEVHLVEGSEELFKMAHKYEVNGLASLCEAHLASSLDVSYAADRLVLADLYSLPFLKETSIRFIGCNIKEVSSTADFIEKMDSIGVDIYRELVKALM